MSQELNVTKTVLNRNLLPQLRKIFKMSTKWELENTRGPLSHFQRRHFDNVGKMREN